MKSFMFVLAFAIVGLTAMAQNPDTPKSVSLSLRNTSAKSIPLVIPGVMNPNLSPFSNSGVRVVVGQKFYFYPKGKKFMGKKVLLFEATPEMDGDTLIVNELIKERKKEF